MLKQLFCFQFQRASFSNSSHISSKYSIVLFRPVPKYLGGEIYNRVVSSASLFLWSLHSAELAPHFEGTSSTLLAGLFSTPPLFFCLSLFMSQPNSPFFILTSPWCFAPSLKVMIAGRVPCLPFSLCLFRSVLTERLSEEGFVYLHFTRRGESKASCVLCRNSICLLLPAWYNEIPLSIVQKRPWSILVITLLHSGSEITGSGK